jgi:RHS repeat-associated protein
MILMSLARSLAVCGILMSTPLCAGETGSSTTSYWYGGSLHPLVVTRDGVDYRLIGKSVVEMMGSQVTRSYLSADRLGSVRMVTDDQGKVVQSLGYDDFGSTRIEGQSAAASFDGMASFYRFQGQEQEVFPLARLGIDDPSLAQWLDEIQLYHFPWRDYAAGFAAFTETDPVPTEDSLYAALGANPVNITDETGGMMNNGPVRFIPAHLNISPLLQELLDRLLENPSANFTFEEIIAMHDLRMAVVRQRYLINPFAPRGILGKRSTETFLGHLDVTEQRRRDARRALMNLHREQDEWLNTYMRPIGGLWDKMNNTGDPWDSLSNPFDSLDVDEDHNGQDHSIRPIETDNSPLDADPNNAPDEEDDSKMPELVTDMGLGDVQLPSSNAEIQPVQSVEENKEHDEKHQERDDQHEDEEHGNHDIPCCNIL